jgi:hypothetical protein
MYDWLTEVIGDAEDALRWLRERASHLRRVARLGHRLAAVDGGQHR